MDSDVLALQQGLRELVKSGEVVSTSPGNGTVRVQFKDSGDTVSYNMQVLFRRTHRDKHIDMPDIGDQVACLFLGNGPEAGFVLGCTYNAKDLPPVANQDVDHTTYEDGTIVEYDRASHTLTANVKGRAEIITTQDIKATAGTTASITAPVITLNGILQMQASGGGGTSAALTGNMSINGNMNINGNLSVSGNSDAATRTGGVPPH